MINLILNISPCNQPDVLKVVALIKTIFKIAFTIIPIVIIVYVLIDLFKNVIAGKEEDMKSGVKLAIKRIVYGIVIFFIPTIVMAVNNILGDLGVKYSDCLTNSTKEGIAKAKVEYNNYLASLQEDINNNINTNNDKTITENGEEEEGTGFNNLKNGEEESTTDKTKTNIDNTDDTETSDITEENAKILFVGDSRTVEMCDNLSLNDCVAKVSQGYDWLNGTADAKIKSKINDEGYNVIIINLGVNDFHHINSYIAYYNKFITRFPQVKLIVSSVTQINDTLAAKKGYSAKNEQVITFNKTLKDGLSADITYCDVYNNETFKRKYETRDGIHYKRDTYVTMYNVLKSCV